MKLRIIALALLVALSGCRRDSAPQAKDPVAFTGSAAQPAKAPGPATPAPSPADDPWSAPDDDPPDATTTKALADKACPVMKAPFYYRATKNGKTSYLLGTRHLGVPLEKLPQKVKDQILKSSLVVFETPPGDNAEGDAGDGKSLKDKIGPELWNKYVALVGRSIASQVEDQKPSVALLMLMMMYEDKMSALDLEIELMVKMARIKTGGLETSAFQEKLLEELLDVRMLKATIQGTVDRKTLEKESLEDLAEYCAGTDDTPGMDERAIKQLKAGGYTDAEIKRMDEKLLDERNIAWMPQLEKMFATGNVFIVVGADHLIGKQGVIEMLKAKGFKTERIAP